MSKKAKLEFASDAKFHFIYEQGKEFGRLPVVGKFSLTLLNHFQTSLLSSLFPSSYSFVHLHLIMPKAVCVV